MLFSVPDFVGDACKAIASRIRGSVASVQFDDFHKVTNTFHTCVMATPASVPGWCLGPVLTPLKY